MVIDADGINALSETRDGGRGAAGILRKALAPVILTPHPGEMAGLLLSRKPEVRSPKSEERGPRTQNSQLRTKIEQDRIATAVNFAKETRAHLILKGVPTVIAEPQGKAFINPTGNPGMATAGSGDVLTGMVASFLAQGQDPLNAAVLGAYMHGLAGDLAAGRKGMPSLIASDIIEALPDAFRELIG
jgi:NAD(P)H-hydrate epimerase